MRRAEILSKIEAWRSDWEIHKSYDQPAAVIEQEILPLVEAGELDRGAASRLIFAAMAYANDGGDEARERLEEALAVVPE